AGHEQVDDPLRFCREMRLREDPLERRASRRKRGAARGFPEQLHQRKSAHAHREPAEELAAIHVKVDVVAEHGAVVCHSERSEESRGIFAAGKHGGNRSGFFASLRMTEMGNMRWGLGWCLSDS